MSPETEAILDALEEAIRARLIHEEVVAERYRFTHALVQDTLYAELSAGQRLRLHAKVGHALEEVYAADLAPHYGELAHHFAIAAPAGYAAEAAEYAFNGRAARNGPTRLGVGDPALRARPPCPGPASGSQCRAAV